MPHTAEAAEVILAHLRACPEGVPLDDLASVVPQLPRRTLQRRLATLVAAGQIEADGVGDL